MNLKLSPLTEEQQKALDQLNKRLNEAQAYWLAGFYQGRLHAGFTNGHALKPEILTSRVANQTTKKLTVLYGTHTGHSQSISNQLQVNGRRFLFVHCREAGAQACFTKLLGVCTGRQKL